MRNLKRALSLALASVMLVGMMVVGTSAASFPDVDSNDNTEAISVLNAVEVMIGDENGNFNPDNNVTRNQMAVILAKLILGKDADKYVGDCPFTDVPEWAQKYVAACYDNKIVAGRTESLYDGNSTVTAQEAAAMVLRTLGYQKLESKGTNWAQPVVAKANEISLFKDVAASATTPLNRNQVAQLALNALKADVVTSEVTEDIIVQGVVTIPGKATYSKVEAKKADDYRTVGADQDEVLQLCEKLYSDLKLDSGATDDFGRPASIWEYKKDPVVTVADGSDYSIVVDEKNKDLAYWAGEAHKGMTVKAGADVVTANGGASANANLKIGDVVEFFNVEKNVAGSVVITRYSVGKVTTLSTNKDGDVSYTVTKDTGDGAGTASGKIYADDTKDTVVVDGDIAKDDIVTYVQLNVSGDKITYIYATTNFDGVQSAINTNKSTIKVDGKDYKVVIADATSDNFPVSKDEATYYVDQFGNVVKREAIENSSNYAVVDGIQLKDGKLGTTQSVEARLVFTDGTSDVYNISEINGVKAKDIEEKTDSNGKTVGITVSGNTTKVILSADENKNTALSAKVVKYSKSGDSYKLTYETGFAERTGTVGSGDATKKGVPAFTYNTDGTTKKENGTSDTIYIIKTDDAKYSVYTGYENVPTVTYKASNAITVAYSVKSSKVNMVYVDGAKADVGDTSNEVVYILNYKTGYATENDSGDTIYVYSDAVLNGKEQEITSKHEFTANGFYEVEMDGDEVKNVVAQVNQKYVYGAPVTAEGEENTLYINNTGYGCKDADGVYVIDGDTFSDGNGKSAAVGDTVYYKVKGSGADAYKIEVAYIVKAEDGKATAPADIDDDKLGELFENNDTVVIPDELDSSADLTVPADKTLVIETSPDEDAEITLESGATVELGENVDTLPTITGDGTVVIKGEIASTNDDQSGHPQGDLDKIESLLGVETATPEAANGAKAVATQIARGVKVQSDGKILDFDSVNTVKAWAQQMNSDAVTFQMFDIPVTASTEATVKAYWTSAAKVTAKAADGTDDAKWTQLSIGYGKAPDGSTVASSNTESSITVMIPVGVKASAMKYEVTQSGQTTSYYFYFENGVVTVTPAA